MESNVKQCAVLLINRDGAKAPHRQQFERLGFTVRETREWPGDDVIPAFEVVIFLLRDVTQICMIAARIRAKPHFGRRVLIAVVPDGTSPAEQRGAIGGGFDDVVSETADMRLLLARIIRRLRARPEYRCFVPSQRKRKAA